MTAQVQILMGMFRNVYNHLGSNFSLFDSYFNVIELVIVIPDLDLISTIYILLCIMAKNL